MIAIALNTSIIDLLTKDGSPLTVADGVEPLPPSWLEGWLRGETPWPTTCDTGFLQRRVIVDCH